MEPKKIITCTVGRLVCGYFRDFLKKAQFYGYKFEFIESSGFIERDFIIQGHPDDIKKLSIQIDKWMKDINSD